MEVILPPYTQLVRNYFKSNLKPQTIKNRLATIANDIHSIYGKLSLSVEGYKFDAMENPFFQQPEGIKPTDFLQNLDMNQFKTQRNRLPKDVVINPWLLTLYLFTGSPHREINAGNYIIFSFEQMVDRILGYKERNPSITWTDIGHMYLGMGHVMVLRMDTQNGQLFQQPDGGSNGWDRHAYWQEYKDQKVSKDNYIGFMDFIRDLKLNQE